MAQKEKEFAVQAEGPEFKSPAQVKRQAYEDTHMLCR